ncbi:MAG TPA: hypothetical protein VMV50_02880 [Candidatus Paceibacterota bacterium]|nr:hypothetical protein [Candidatus Paceibacterota bacterium]
MTKYLIIVVLVVLAGYGVKEAVPLLAGPALAVSAPADGMTASPSGIVVVSGTAARAAVLTLDGAQLLHDQDGSFSSTLTLPRGGSILTLVATDRFGRSVTRTRTVYVP